MSLRREIISSVLWTALGKYSGMFFSIIITMVLARLISPAEFGIVAIAQIIINFFCFFADLGISSAVVQNKSLTDKNLDSLFTFSIILAFILSIAFYVISPLIASYYKNSELINICHILAFNLFIGTISVVPSALFNRDKRFKFIAKRSLLVQLLSGLLSIIYAFYGGGVYALVFPMTISTFCILCVNLYEYPRHIDWKFNLEPIKRIFSYSSFIFLYGIVDFFSTNLDKLIIGRSLDMKSLGLYQKSYSLMLMPMGYLSFVITPVLQPYLSDYQDDINFIKEKYLQLIKLLSIISIPIGIFSFFAAKELIRIFYGDNWIYSAPAFSILSLSIPFLLILSTAGSIFQSTNNTKLLFITGLFNTAFVALGFLICGILKGSLEMFSYVWDIACVSNFLFTFYVLFKKVFLSSVTEFFLVFKHPLIYCISLILVLTPLSMYSVDVNYVVLIILKFITILLISLSLNYFMKDINITGIINQLTIKFLK